MALPRLLVAALAVLALMPAPLARLAVGQGLDLPPDLVVSAIATDPETPAPGDAVTFVVTVANAGLGEAGHFRVSLALDDQGLGEPRELQGLGVGESADVEFGPWTANVGNHTADALADSSEEVDESDEENNAATEQLFVGPNLIVTDITWEPEDIHGGDDVRINATIENSGPNDAEGSFDVQFLMDGDVIHTVSVDGLDADESLLVEGPHWTAVEGDHNVSATVDAADAVDEWAEGDNTRGELLDAMPEGPDLVATRLVWQPDLPAPGEELTLDATIANRGNEASEPFRVRFAIDDEQLGDDVDADALGPGNETTVQSAAWASTFGNHTFNVTVDVPAPITGAETEETNETNNALNVTLAIGPDLVTDNVTWTEANDTLSFVATLTNAGTSNATDFAVQFLVDDGTEIGRVFVDDLGPRLARNVTGVTWNRTEGEHTLLVVADPDGVVNETHEGNNRRVANLSEPSAPAGLLVTLVQVVGRAEEGRALRFLAHVENEGDAPVRDVEVRFLLDDDVDVGSAEVPEVPPRTRLEVESPPWNATVGTHTVTTRVSIGGVVQEQGAAAATALTFTVVPKGTTGTLEALPNLRVKAIDVPTILRVGENVTVNATVENVGDAAAGPFQVRFLYDGQVVIDETTLDGLAPDGSARASGGTLLVEPGLHLVSVRVDALDQVNELDEADNTRSRALGVSEVPVDEPLEDTNATLPPPDTFPDAVIASVRWDPASPEEGDEVVFHVVVQNVGSSTATGLQVLVSVGDESLGEASVGLLPPDGREEITSPPWTARAGAHVVSVVADPRAVVDEESDANNEWSDTIVVEEGSLVPATSLLMLLSLVVVAAVATRAARRAR